MLNDCPTYLMIPKVSVKSDLITKNEFVVYTPLASKETHGIVKIGDGLNIDNGIISFDKSEVTIKSISKNGTLILPDEYKNVNIELYKQDVGLSEVDNTSDKDKPVSISQQIELDKKFNIFQGSDKYGKILYVNSQGNVDFRQPTGTLEIRNENELINSDTQTLDFTDLFLLTSEGTKVKIDGSSILKGTFSDVSYDGGTGVLTFTKLDGSEVTVDLPLELIVSGGYYDTATHDLILILANGDEIPIPLDDIINWTYSNFIPGTETNPTDSWLITENREGSITIGADTSLATNTITINDAKITASTKTKDINLEVKLSPDSGFTLNEKRILTVDDLSDVMTITSNDVITGSKIFVGAIGLSQTDGADVAQIRNYGTAISILGGDGNNILYLNEVDKNVSAFNKRLAFADEIPDLPENFGTTVFVDGAQQTVWESNVKLDKRVIADGTTSTFNNNGSTVSMGVQSSSAGSIFGMSENSVQIGMDDGTNASTIQMLPTSIDLDADSVTKNGVEIADMSDISNMATTDTEQTISGKKTFDNIQTTFSVPNVNDAQFRPILIGSGITSKQYLRYNNNFGYIGTTNTLQVGNLTNGTETKSIKEISDAVDKVGTMVIPTALSDLTDDTTHRLVTDTEKQTWNNKLSSFTESDPTVPAVVKAITQANITNWNGKPDVSFSQPSSVYYINANPDDKHAITWRYYVIGELKVAWTTLDISSSTYVSYRFDIGFMGFNSTYQYFCATSVNRGWKNWERTGAINLYKGGSNWFDVGIADDGSSSNQVQVFAIGKR